MAIEKFIIDKSDLAALLRGEELAIQPRGNIRGFCVEIASNVTNGDMVKAMFKITTLKEDDDFIAFAVDGLELARFVIEKKWWDADYKGEISEE